MWKAVALVGGAVVVVLLLTRESKDAAEVCEFEIERFLAHPDAPSSGMSILDTNTLLRLGTRADTNAVLKQFHAEVAKRGPAGDGLGWRLRRTCFLGSQREQGEHHKIDYLAHV